MLQWFQLLYLHILFPENMKIENKVILPIVKRKNISNAHLIKYVTCIQVIAVFKIYTSNAYYIVYNVANTVG